jgi:hypothetical protein
MRPLLCAAIESSVQPTAYHGMWAKLPDPVVERFAAASGIGVPHHGGSIALEAVPVAVSRTAARMAVSQKHLLNRRFTKSPPYVRASPQGPGIDFAT